MEEIKEILNSLNQTRKKKNIKTSDLSHITGLSEASIEYYLASFDGRHFNLETVRKIARYIDPKVQINGVNQKCLFCGKEYVSETLRKSFCSEECKKESNKMAHKRYENAYAYFNSPVIKKTGSIKSLNIVAKEAANAGMTYGKYVAKMEGK